LQRLEDARAAVGRWTEEKKVCEARIAAEEKTIASLLELLFDGGCAAAGSVPTASTVRAPGFSRRNATISDP